MKIYSTKEVSTMLKISIATWRRRREEILDFLDLFWEYDVEITKNNNVKFLVYKEYSELPPLPTKERDSLVDYTGECFDFIVATLQINREQTGVSIAGLMKLLGFQFKEGKDYAESSLAKLAAPVLRRLYSSLPQEAVESVWVRKVRVDKEGRKFYSRMSQEHIDAFRKILKERRAAWDFNAKAEEQYYEDINSGVSKRKSKENIGGMWVNDFESALYAFKQIYGYIPIKIKVVKDEYMLENFDLVLIRTEIIRYMKEKKQKQKKRK